MSTILLHPRRLRTSIFFLGILLLGILNGGCGSRQISLKDPIQRASWEQPEYNSADDGIPLTAAEQKALASTGQLDKGLSEAALRDVAAQYKYFLHKGRTTMERFAQRSQGYLAYSRKVFRDKGLPEELAFLAIVESGYNARAVSPVGAAGAWQFMPYTGMKYGLNQDWWMDERLDPYKATEAAADYLAKLYGDFRDWHLAVAAYNAGEGKIGRALAGTGAKNFFALKEKNHLLDSKAQLKEETKQYVPRFLAICKIMRNLDTLGFTPVDMNRPAQLARVQVRPGTDLMGLAAATGQSWNEFSENNAAHKRYVSHTDRSTYAYVPLHQQSAAVAYASNPRSGSGWKTMVAGKGESWKGLSQKTGIPVAALQSANRSSTLRAGSTVRLPAGPDFKMPAPEREYAQASEKKPAQGRAARTSQTSAPAAPARGETASHVLKSGETLHGLARQYNTTVPALLAMNDVDDPRQLRAGQKVRVPAADAAGSAPAKSAPGRSVAAEERGSSDSLGGASKKSSTRPATYTVQAGDTLWAIARKHNISTSQLLTLNGTDGKSPLRPGDKIQVSEQ